ncbi:hypothetical protein LTR94_023888 [Friedmanniomyces endolithicus]|nr:hypothetical protein LTR94_023888 [Friedmanniomyces endolithicus]
MAGPSRQPTHRLSHMKAPPGDTQPICLPALRIEGLTVPTFIDALSTDRFQSYLDWANQDQSLAERLYTFNVQLSAALYGPLHMLEVVLRNKVDAFLTQAYGAAWLDDVAVLTDHYQRGSVQKARQKLVSERKAATHSQIIAELNFGFWCSLFGRQSHHLWQTLRPVFQSKGVQRGAVAQELRELRILRNRIAHYELILPMPLAQRYAGITTWTGWLSPTAAAWITCYSTWPNLYPAVPLLVPAPQTGVLKAAPAAAPFPPA